MKWFSSIILLSAVFCMYGCTESTSSPSIIRTIPEKTVDVQTLKKAAIEIISEGLTDENAYIRIHSIEVISGENLKEMMPRVTELLKDRSVPVRFASALAIGDMKYGAGEFAVASLLDDSDENVKIAAAYALVKLGRAGYDGIIRKALSGGNQTVRANAALLLGKIGNKNDVPYLYEVIRDMESADKVKIQAIESLAMLGDQSVYRNKLWPMLISKHPDDKIMGIKGMGILGTVEAKDAILTMLDDEIPEVRLCAAEQLGSLRNRRGQSEVETFFAGKVPYSTETAVAYSMATSAIGTIGGPGLTKYLPELLQSRSKVVRVQAARSVLRLIR